MRYYSEVEVRNNELYKQRVCEAPDAWAPSKEGLRLVIDEEPPYDRFYQQVIRTSGEVPGDSVPYEVVDTGPNITELAPENDRTAAEVFLTARGVSANSLVYEFSGFSTQRDADFYNVFVADEIYYLKTHDGVVIEYYEVTTQLGGFGVSRDLVSNAPLDRYERTGTEITKYPMNGEKTVTRYYGSEPPARASLDPKYKVRLWSLKATGDIVIEYRKYRG